MKVDQAIPADRPSYLSRTNWSNLVTTILVIIGGWVPALKTYITPELVAGLFMAVNFAMRLVTKGKITLW